MRRPYDLPPLTTLAAFEAAARHGSMKDAAAELNVTPGAVSRQVKALEGELRRPLFVRVHRGIELTLDGAELSEALARGFTHVADVCRRIRDATDGPSLTIGATTAFAGFWLIPRIGAFWQDHPEITVNHAVSDDPIDLRRGPVDLALRYGLSDWPGTDRIKLFGDRLFPVCSPAFKAAHAGVRAGDLSRLPLLRLKGVDPAWIDWDSFLAWAGLGPIERPKGGRSLNNYTVVIQAARDGQGVALGWERLVGPMIESGELVRLTDLAMPAPGAHYLAWSADRVVTPAMAAFRDWVMTQ
ncbi:MAG: LysR substrate-binding domain-containing protein [Alphaproteobacteria bacterium]